MAAIEEVVDWATATNENLAHHPTGPQGRDARRTSISFQEMQAAIARWRDSLGGGSPLTTKGDIYTYSTIDDRLPVGTNGQLLSANAGEATGLLWVDPPAGTIGGSITDNQIAVGAATADEIEGTATLTYDATYLKMDDVAPFGLMLTNTSSGANAKKFSFDNYFGIAGIRFWNDAESSATELVTYQRSGTTATTISHQGNRFVFFPDSTDQGFDIHHNILELGNPLSGSAARISTPLTSDTLRLQAGTLNFGSHIELNGSSATNANDFRIGHGASLEIIAYDYSAGQLTLKSGGASPAVAVTIDNSQHVTFAEKVIFDASTTADPSLNIPEGVAPTTPVDGDVWVTAAGEFFAHLNGVSVDLAAGGGGVGISGTPVNNQLAVWTDATTIEGEPSLTFNNANDRLTIGAGAAGAANPQLTIDAQLAGVPEIAFLQAGATKAFISYVDVDDMFAIGADNEIEFRPFNSGDWGILSTTSAKFGNYTFNTDQTVGVGQDNFVLTYDNASGEISLEAAPATTPGGSNLQLQYNDNGAFNGSSFCYFDLSGTSGQNPTLFIDASDPTTFWRNPRLRLVHDQHDVSHIEFYEELVRKADIRYESLSAGALDSLHIQNFTNAQVGSTTTGAIYLTVRTSGGSNQSKLRANQYGVEFLNGNIRLYARASANYPDSTTTGQIYINNGDNLLYFRDGSGIEYDLTGSTVPTATIVQGNDPYIGWIEDDATLDQGYWRIIADGEALIGRIYDDIETNSYDWLTVNRSGTGAGVQVDTIDFTAATDVTVNSDFVVTGNFTSIGIDDNATGERLELSDTDLVLGTTGANYTIRKPDTAAGLVITGGNVAGNGSDIVVYGSTHGTTGDMLFRNGGNVFMQWDESLGAYTVSTGVGAKTLALTINSSQQATFADNVTVGDQTSANAALIVDGSAAADVSVQVRQAGVLKGFMQYQDTGDKLVIDSDGQVEIASANTTALTIDTSQNVTSTGAILSSASTATRAGLNIAEGVAPTTPVDGDVWVTAAGAFNARLNGVTVDLSATGGGGGYTVTTQTGTSYTASAGDCVLATNTGTVTITLPVPAADDTIIVKKTGATGTVNVTPASGDNIDGSTAAYAMSTQYESVTLISDGTDWFVV